MKKEKVLEVVAIIRIVNRLIGQFVGWVKNRKKIDTPN